MKYDDMTLARLSGQGDEDAFAQLVDRYSGLVYSLALQRLGSRQDAEDVTQNVFWKAWKALPNFREESSFSTWLYRMTANAVTDQLRLRGRREPPLSLDDPDLPQTPHPGPGPAELMQEEDRRQALYQAIDSLPDQARSILLLREFQGFSYEEIAEAMDLPLGTVRSRLARARRALAKILLEEGNFWDGYSSNQRKKERGEHL